MLAGTSDMYRGVIVVLLVIIVDDFSEWQADVVE